MNELMWWWLCPYGMVCLARYRRGMDDEGGLNEVGWLDGWMEGIG